MKESKLQKLLLEAKKAHQESSATLKKVTLETATAKKMVKERKRRLSETRKAFKAARKNHRQLAASLKELGREHEKNSQRIKQLTKKSAKLSGAAHAKSRVNRKGKARIVRTPLPKSATSQQQEVSE